MSIDERDTVADVESRLRLWSELMADAALGDCDRRIVFDGLAQRIREDADALASLLCVEG